MGRVGIYIYVILIIGSAIRVLYTTIGRQSFFAAGKSWAFWVGGSVHIDDVLVGWMAIAVCRRHWSASSSVTSQRPCNLSNADAPSEMMMNKVVVGMAVAQGRLVQIAMDEGWVSANEKSKPLTKKNRLVFLLPGPLCRITPQPGQSIIFGPEQQSTSILDEARPLPRITYCATRIQNRPPSWSSLVPLFLKRQRAPKHLHLCSSTGMIGKTERNKIKKNKTKR